MSRLGFAMQHGCSRLLCGQTAKALMSEREVTLHDRLCIELCVVVIELQTQDVDVNESKKRKDKGKRRCKIRDVARTYA